jgi:hypothetical protein
MIESNQLGLVARDYAAALRLIHDDTKNIRIMTHIAGNWIKYNLSWERYGESMVKYFEEVSK